MHTGRDLSIARFIFSNMESEIPAKKQHFELSKFHAFSLVKGRKKHDGKICRKGLFVVVYLIRIFGVFTFKNAAC